MRFSAVIDSFLNNSRERWARQGWNGKGQSIGLVVPAEAGLLPYIEIQTVTGESVPWLASQTDMLAQDWEAAAVVNG